MVLIDGLINDCAKKVQEINREGVYFDMTTLKEPYRLEGKKTMGYEIAEQLRLSPKTVETHRTHIKEKLNLKNARGVARFAVQWLAAQSA